MLSHPLTPFFVVFCYVVWSSSVEDFELLQNVTSRLARFTEINHSVDRMHKLCSAFVHFCKPIVEAGPPTWQSLPADNKPACPRDASTEQSSTAARPASFDINQPNAQGARVPWIDAPSLEPTSVSVADGQQPVSSFPNSLPEADTSDDLGLWQDDIMWQLLEAKPSADWFQADFLNMEFPTPQ